MINIETINQSERMMIAETIDSISESDSDTFLASQAEYLFTMLEGLKISNHRLSVTATVTDSVDALTSDGPESMDDEKEHKFNVGKKHEFRCGTCVITKTGSDFLEARRVGDTNAAQNDGEVLRLQRLSNRRYEASLNKPFIIDLPFLPKIIIAGNYKPWKTSAGEES